MLRGRNIYSKPVTYCYNLIEKKLDLYGFLFVRSSVTKGEKDMKFIV